MPTDKPAILPAWSLRMAWRDSRRSRRRLLLYSTSIMMGIAALVAIGSFGRSLGHAMDQQAKSLLGADLAIHSRQPFTPDAAAFLQSLGGAQTREVSFATMIQFVKGGGSRLVQVRAIEGDFPYYGTLETEPTDAAGLFRTGRGALVEESLMTQFEAAVGDTIQLGELQLPIVGTLKRVPGETIAFATLSPRVFIALANVEKTDLLQPGSLARYKVYYQFAPGTDTARLVNQIEPRLRTFRMRHETVERRRENLGESLENLSHFLHLVGFIALLLGGIGIASAIHTHIKQRLGTVAILRCLGASVRQTFAIYLVQGMALGFVGALLGTAIGLGLQSILPAVVRDFLPFEVESKTSWSAVTQAAAVGFAICLLFAMRPLLSVRRVSPLTALRSPGANAPASWRDPLVWVIHLLIAAGVVAFSLAQTRRAVHGFGFAAGLGIAFLLLAVVAKAIAVSARRLLRVRMPFVLRQGLANLYRPNNRTVLLMLSLGMGTFLILTLFFTHETLLRQLSITRQEDRPNAILFDIQPDQFEGVAALVRSLGMEVMQHAPIVTMRLTAIKGRDVESILADPNRETPGWALSREYRCTYRDYLTDTETPLAGEWPPRNRAAITDAAVPISIEEGIARDLGVTMGDTIAFNVQGIPMLTRVVSMRKVEWRRVQPNFFIVFPVGVLEAAPSFHIVATRVRSAQESATLQREVLRQFPNVSAIDLTLIIQTIDSIVTRIASVIRFMATFTVVTGLLVLFAALSTGRYQRLQESMLLRTLGASRRQVLHILTTEYLCLGLFAGLTGIGLALAAGWALAAFVFKAPFVPSFVPMAIALAVSCTATVLAGMFSSRGICNHPPLEILRAEV